MKNPHHYFYQELLQKIEFLKEEKGLQEEQIKYQFDDIVKSINPVTILKQSIITLTNDNEIKVDIAKLAINLGTNYAIDKIMNKNNSIKDYLFSIVGKKFPNSFATKIIKQIK